MAKRRGDFVKSISVYLDAQNLAFVDAFVEKFRRENPGMVCKRCDAIRALLTRAMLTEKDASTEHDTKESQ